MANPQAEVAWSDTLARFRETFSHPSDIFSTLLLLGPDVISRAVAQQSGTAWFHVRLPDAIRICGQRIEFDVAWPVAFSFGWVSYGLSMLASVIGEDRLLPVAADSPCIVINGKSKQLRGNNSWILGRLIRDYPKWAEKDVKDEVNQHIMNRMNKLQEREETPQAKANVQRPPMTSLCVVVYSANENKAQGVPDLDWISHSGLVMMGIQLGIAIIPIFMAKDWVVLKTTFLGTLLAWSSLCFPQWRREKWACRQNTNQHFVLTKGNGTQYALYIKANDRGLNLEDLASAHVPASTATKIGILILAIVWIYLLLSSSNVSRGWGTGCFLAIGGMGMLQNILVAAWPRGPGVTGLHLKHEDMVMEDTVIDTLLGVERKYETVGQSMLNTFFPNGLKDEDKQKWEEVARIWEEKRTATSGS
ncbi:hypothetical protein BDV96DRAFT_540674 [Lophiotrema nucula]|uniref:Uncharacterized protein n=1 Tax=Lophiotrema nucula TaxID=690887 RepID=A0A6A5ZKF0_9PLEO|nr:hypothetical protein BDV96DRAFT_540674 [Lophiotrema nucula]